MTREGAFVELEELALGFDEPLRRVERLRHEPVPTMDSRVSSFDNEHRARSELLDSLEQREWRWRIAIAQEQVERHGIDVDPTSGGPQERPNL